MPSRSNRILQRAVCKVIGHKRFDDPPTYWHSHERCSYCDTLDWSPMVMPWLWRGYRG